ncbi:hypothetical protein VE01_10457 [Pseudogymnoascus verrucosus]|uniref:C2 domain-containing protein n=1 Tax=Pseudogymnoascus verrucosus TaxID=342668 RepID=A0A1B8G708_9PEZI|nr:uncharacterized protein VE01_10457 [Pseudogymnoascus verrucosus]OBT91626.1 hypothetical protein VE01_10457 [Pseudogymnoascus verrucosus]
MSTSSSRSARGSTTRRLPRNMNGSLSDRLSRTVSRFMPKVVTYNESYTYALRAAFLHHLLQPRAKRKQYLPAPKAISHRASTVGDLVKDLSGVGSAKSAKLPHGFMGPLEKRMTGVLMMKERLPGYNDPAVKRSFAEAYTAFTETTFRRRMEQERRVEDLVLIFYSNAVKSLQKGKPPGDDSWKNLLDRHVALFLRLLSNTMKDHGYDKDRPELMSRLATLEKKLLTDDQDLSSGAGPSDSYIEVVNPISYDVKDMPMVLVVGRIFGMRNSQVQSDIDANKKFWTEEVALTELKSYQQCINSQSARVLSSNDFDVDEGYQAWKKAESHDLSQLMLDILHVKPELAKSSSASTKPAAPPTTGPNKPLPTIIPVQPDADYYNTISSPTERTSLSSFSQTQPADMSGLSLSDEPSTRLYLEEVSFVYIPPDPRAYYRSILMHAATFDQLHTEHNAESGAPAPPLSMQSLELLTELAIRWRVPQFSRLILYLDVSVQRFKDREIGLEELDAAFEMIKNPPAETKKSSTLAHAGGLQSIDRSHWTINDMALYRHTLVSVHDSLLRDLYDVLQHCYDSKPPSVGPVMVILESHIYNDECFQQSPEQVQDYSEQLDRGLREKAAAVYRGYLEAEVPQNQEEWQFYHVVQLGKSVVKLCTRIQKRYKKNPEFMGVNPLTVLVETMFPSFENDAADLIQRIMNVAHANNSEVDLEDGFALYKELVEIRRIHQQALPDVPFAFHIEDALADFVWRWINVADEKMVDLVDQAILHDKFEVRSENPTDNERHSVSAIDVFRLFNETTDQIFQLNWDDDVHHAKFMTALSKSFGVGLARYCEAVEERFTKEMNRLTPEQEAAAKQSKQDRWMQLAKDAWNNKEKMEPFQFHPQSLVKLNNIEFAVQQLDKLEKMMNVDACAEVLQRNITPKEQQQMRKPNKYVFTVKIVEGEDLKACDTNGLSDPYVILGDEFKKRLMKTRVVPKNLNPRWDESIDIIVSGPVNIVATIWDFDTFGDDDLMGRTSLKLDPSHFSDYLPKECWLNLDTQGKLLLRIGMEGERDDIQFYFGKAFRLLKRTERDMIRKITDKLSTYINLSLSPDALRSLLSRGISITSMWKTRQSLPPPLLPIDIENALKPLFTYFDDNFAIMQQTLTTASMIAVMTRLWKEVLLAIEALLIPPLSDKPSPQKALSRQEADTVFMWLELLRAFFNARDEETGEAMGVPDDVLKNAKYHELKQLAFFYFDPTDSLIKTSERMASATAARALAQRTSLSLPPGSLGPSLGVGLGSATSLRRGKSIMLSRNLGTMRQAKEEKRREAQADPSDDVILRILRMRHEGVAVAYLRDRSRQRERLAAAAAAESIVRQSLGGGGRFGGGNLPRR